MERAFNLPDLGEGLTEGEVVRWLVAPGDTVTLNQPLVEVETAKAAVELPSPFAGRVARLHAQEGDTVDVGAPLVSVEVEGGEPAAGAAGPEAPAATEPEPAQAAEEERQPTLVGPGPRAEGRRRRAAAPAADGSSTLTALRPKATPPVRRYARDRGVDLAPLTGTGRDGRITHEDVDAALAAQAAAAAGPAPSEPPAAPPPAAPVRRQVAGERGEQRIPVRGTRRTIAARMVASASSIPHVTEFVTVDATGLVALRDRLRALPQAEGVRVTPLAIVARALCVALRDHPLLNSAWQQQPDGTAEIVVKDHVHLGIATDTPAGLLVPNVKDADTLGVIDLAREIARLTALARDRRASPADLTGGTVTITNVGGLGVDTGTPIINQPECAILATGAIADRPWVVDGELTVRSLMTLSLSFDHRIVDGAGAARFLNALRELVEAPVLLAAF
jgi:2-oxoisovalerate dehydrogenase E2 component (dihydrolipoyl transacylase)